MPIHVGSKAPDFTLKSKNASGLVDVKLSAEVAEDGEGEGVAAACVVKREVSGARGESGPRRHECMSGSVPQ